MIEAYGEDLNNHPNHDHELWLRACGGRKKGRLIGASDADDPVFVLTGTPGTPASGTGSSRGPTTPVDPQVSIFTCFFIKVILSGCVYRKA